MYKITYYYTLSHVQVGFNKDGKLDALDIDIYLNGGATQDLSIFVSVTKH